MSQTPESSPVAQVRCCIVGDASTQPVIDDIVIGLGKLGFAVRTGEPQPHDGAVVVVLSNAWLAEADTLADLVGPRLVPVTCGPVDDELVPPDLAILNWIPWNPAERGRTLQSIANAAATDLNSFRALQSLQARADGWASSGKRAKDVVTTKSALRALEAELAAAGRSKLSPHVEEFVLASRGATRAETRRRWVRTLAWLVVGCLLVAASVNVWQRVQAVRQRSGMDLVANSAIEIPNPGLQLPKYAALIQLDLDQGISPPTPLIHVTLEALAARSQVRMFGSSPDKMFFNAASVAADGTLLLGDGGGSLWTLRPGAAEPSLVARQVLSHVYALATGSGQSVWAVADDATVAVHLTSGDRRIAAPGARRLVLAPDDATLIVMRDEVTEVYDLTVNPARLVRSVPASQMLAAAPVAGRVELLARHSGTIQLIDALTGREARSWPDIVPALGTAAIGPRGQVVASGKDHRLWLAAEAGWTPTGIAVADLMASLAVTASGQLVYTISGGLTRVVDLATLTARGQICTEAVAQGVTISPDGDWAVCDYGAVNSLWRIGDLLPVGAGISQATREAAAGGVSAAVDSSGVQIVAADGSRHTLAASASSGAVVSLAGRPTAVGLSPGGAGLGIGSDTGDLVTLDLSPSGVTSGGIHWQSPDGSAVQAVSLTSTSARVTTTTGQWVVRACVGCSTNPDLLLASARQAFQPCYTAELTGMIGKSLSRRLGVVACKES